MWLWKESLWYFFHWSLIPADIIITANVYLIRYTTVFHWTIDVLFSESKYKIALSSLVNHLVFQFKRVAGPKNRRTPTRPSLSRKPGEDGADDLKDICQLDNESSRDDADKSDGGDESPKAVSPLLQKKDFLGIAEDDDEDDDDVVIPDENHNATKPSISFLDIHHNNRSESKDVSPERSPTGGQKPYIPPLDLSILHEHGDGSGE